MKPERHWYHLGPGTLLVVGLVVVIGLGWFGVSLGRVKRISDRERMDAMLHRSGGTTNDQYPLEGRTWKWATVRTDAGLECLQHLPELEILDLTDSQITDEGLAHLNKLRHLQRLYLDGTDVTDAGLEHLKGLTQLQVLYLYATQVTDRGVADLQKALPKLNICR